MLVKSRHGMAVSCLTHFCSMSSRRPESSLSWAILRARDLWAARRFFSRLDGSDKSDESDNGKVQQLIMVNSARLEEGCNLRPCLCATWAQDRQFMHPQDQQLAQQPCEHNTGSLMRAQ